MKRNTHVGMQLCNPELQSAHITVAWCGALTDEEIKVLQEDVLILSKDIRASGGAEVQFDEFARFGSIDELKQETGGVTVRKCHVVSAITNALLQKFYVKHYFHEDGEVEERKLRPSYHLTLKPDVSRETVGRLDLEKIECIFVKCKGLEVQKIIV